MHTEFDAKSEARKSDSVRARNRVDTELRTDSKSGVGIDAEANADSAAKYNSEAGLGIRSCESRIRSEREIGLGAESAACVELVEGINSKGHAESGAVRSRGRGLKLGIGRVSGAAYFERGFWGRVFRGRIPAPIVRN